MQFAQFRCQQTILRAVRAICKLHVCLSMLCFSEPLSLRLPHNLLFRNLPKARGFRARAYRTRASSIALPPAPPGAKLIEVEPFRVGQLWTVELPLQQVSRHVSRHAGDAVFCHVSVQVSGRTSRGLVADQKEAANQHWTIANMR